MKCSAEVCGWVDDVPSGGLLAGEVWWCGDDWCDCTQPQIQQWQPGKRWRADLTTRWAGTFQTGGEGWSDSDACFHRDKSSTELNRMAQHLRRHHHDLYQRIRWPWDERSTT